MFIVGKIKTTHGIKGEVKVKNLSDFKRFFIGSKLFIFNGDNKEELTIKSIRPQNEILLISFEGFNDLNDVLRLKSKELFTELEPNENEFLENEFLYKNLIGVSVFFKNEKYVGVVKSILEVPQGQILEVFNENKKVLIPFVKAIVLEVESEKIIIDDLEGLVK